jgi:hypothetical protein
MIEPGDRVSFQHGELLHLDCYEGMTRKPAMRAVARAYANGDEDRSATASAD